MQHPNPGLCALELTLLAVEAAPLDPWSVFRMAAITVIH